jgi:hypothetical protein
MDMNGSLASRRAVRSDKKASERIVARAVSRVRSRRLLGRQRWEVGKNLEGRQKDRDKDSHGRRVARTDRNARASLQVVALRVATTEMRALDSAVDHHSCGGDVDQIVGTFHGRRQRVLPRQSVIVCQMK